MNNYLYKRSFSMEIGRKIGEGANAEVFEWEKNQVIKIAKSTINKTDLEREYHNNLIMWEMGLPVPQPFELVELDNRPGIVFERIYGSTLRERFFEILYLQINNDQSTIDWKEVRLAASLLAKFHHFTNYKLPTQQREFLTSQILKVNYLKDKEKKAVIDILNRLPQNNKICHGDANPNNIIIRNGEPILIDWLDANSGNPEVDVAEFIIMLKYAVLPSGTRKAAIEAFDSNRENMINVFMDEYTRLTGTTNDDIIPWIIPIAAKKLSTDGITEVEKQLLVNEIRCRLEMMD
jgi:serine/threonine protein kinase